MRGVPVGHEHAVPAPLLAKERAVECRVSRAVDPVDAVVGHHHRPGPGLHHGLEGEQVDLPQRPFVDDAVDGGALGLGVVAHEVLWTCGDALRLDPCDVRRRESGSENRILRVALEVAAAERGADDVDHRPQHVVHAGPLRFDTDARRNFRDDVHVPGGAESRSAGSARGARAAREGCAANAVGAVLREHRLQPDSVHAAGAPAVDSGREIRALLDAERAH